MSLFVVWKQEINHTPELPFWLCAPPPLCVSACSRSPAAPQRTTAGTGQRCRRTHLAASCWRPPRSALLPSGTVGPKGRGHMGLDLQRDPAALCFTLRLPLFYRRVVTSPLFEIRAGYQWSGFEAGVNPDLTDY